MILSKPSIGTSFDLRTMSETEFSMTVHDLAKDNPSLENLLFKCYDNGIIPTGVKINSDFSSIELDIAESYRPNVEQMLNSLSRFTKIQLLFMSDGCNPLSGPRWMLPAFSIDTIRKDPDTLFNQLARSLENPVSYSSTPFASMLQLCDLLSNSRTFMDVALTKSNRDTYILAFFFWEGPRSSYLINFFKKQGFSYSRDINRILLSATLQNPMLEIDSLVSAINSEFHPPKLINSNQFNEQAIHILDTEGPDAAEFYINTHRKKV